MDREEVSVVIGRKRYDTRTATLLAHDVYWDGQNFERHGRNTWLYRTPRGAFFKVTRTQWQGERDGLTPVTQEEAIDWYEVELTEHVVDYAEAFPRVAVEEA